MNRYRTIGPFITASVAAGVAAQINIDAALAGFVIPASCNIVKVKIVPTVSAVYSARVYTGAAYSAAQRLIRWEEQSGTLFYPIDVTDGLNVEGLQGWPLPYDEAAGVAAIHFEIENLGAAANTYTYTIQIEEVPVFDASGNVTFRGGITANGDTVALLTAAQVLTNKTISGASNTLTNIGNGSLTNSSVTVTAGVGMSGGGAVSLGSAVTLTNAGVTSAIGTANQVSVSGATGAVTFSLPQNIHTAATPTFGGLTLTAGALASGQNALSVTGTLSNTNAIQRGVNLLITSGTGATLNNGLYVSLIAGNLTTAYNQAISLINEVAGTGTSVIGAQANYGLYGYIWGTTVGTNVANYGEALNGIVNIGQSGRAVTLKNAGTNIGVLGLALNTGTTPIQLGGFFGLMSAAPTFTSAALMADNGATTSPIFVLRDNGVNKWEFVDGGDLVPSTTNTNAIGTTSLLVSAINVLAVRMGGGVPYLDSSTFILGAASNAIWFGRAQLKSPADSIVTMMNNAGTNFDRLQLGGTTSSFPSLKRSTTAIEVKLADDSAYSNLKAILTTSANAVTGLGAGVLSALTNASLVITDGTGTVYRVPCII